MTTEAAGAADSVLHNITGLVVPVADSAEFELRPGTATCQPESKPCNTARRGNNVCPRLRTRAGIEGIGRRIREHCAFGRSAGVKRKAPSAGRTISRVWCRLGQEEENVCFQ